MLCFRVLGASFSRFGCFVLRSSFSSASFSKLALWLLLYQKELTVNAFVISVNQSKAKEFVFCAGSYCCQKTLPFIFAYINYFQIIEKLTENSLT